MVAAARSGLGLDDRHLFVTVQLEEPSKAALAAWNHGDPIDRASRIAVWDQTDHKLVEAIIAVAGEIRERREVPGARAPALLPQIMAGIAATLADPRIREGLTHARGVANIENVHVETWPFGGMVPGRYGESRRLAWTPMWERKTADDDRYPRPPGYYGLYAVLDFDTAEVIDVEDHGTRPIPDKLGHYRQSQLGPAREIRPLDIVQPDGPSFVVDGWHVR